MTGFDNPATWSKEYLVISICRADLKHLSSADIVYSLSDAQMGEIGGKLAEYLIDECSAWEKLCSIAQAVLAEMGVSIERNETSTPKRLSEAEADSDNVKGE